MNFFTKWKKRLRWVLTPEKKKRQKMEDAVELLKLDPQAYALLELARADGVNIYFDPGLVGADFAKAQYRSSKMSIALSPDVSSEKLAVCMAHELRHHWQFKKLGFIGPDAHHVCKNPRLEFIFNRIIEADAYAFQYKFVKVVNETFEATDQTAQGIQNFLEKKADITPDDIRRINEDAEIKFQLSRLGDGRFLRKEFMALLENENLSNSYDPKNARLLHTWHTEASARKEFFDTKTPVPELTIAGIRSLLKAGIAEDSPDYLGEIADRQFEALVLRHAHKGARGTVRLIGKFNAASAANDNKAAKNLRKLVREKVRQL